MRRTAQTEQDDRDRSNCGALEGEAGQTQNAYAEPKKIEVRLQQQPDKQLSLTDLMHAPWRPAGAELVLLIITALLSVGTGAAASIATLAARLATTGAIFSDEKRNSIAADLITRMTPRVNGAK